MAIWESITCYSLHHKTQKKYLISNFLFAHINEIACTVCTFYIFRQTPTRQIETNKKNFQASVVGRAPEIKGEYSKGPKNELLAFFTISHSSKKQGYLLRGLESPFRNTISKREQGQFSATTSAFFLVINTSCFWLHDLS